VTGRDRGSATVFVLAIGLVLLSVALTGLIAGSAVAARHQAQSAADLGALAGAPYSIVDPAMACAKATAVVEANRAAIIGCRIDGVDIVIRTAVPVIGAPAAVGPATAAARAGPLRAADPPGAGDPVPAQPAAGFGGRSVERLFGAAVGPSP
jgi:secretion/DNA translocation related TadE-like protein